MPYTFTRRSGVGRPALPDAERHSVKVSPVRLTEKDVRALTAAASDVGLSVGELVRMLLVESHRLSKGKLRLYDQIAPGLLHHLQRSL